MIIHLGEICQILSDPLVHRWTPWNSFPQMSYILRVLCHSLPSHFCTIISDPKLPLLWSQPTDCNVGLSHIIIKTITKCFAVTRTQRQKPGCVVMRLSRLCCQSLHCSDIRHCVQPLTSVYLCNIQIIGHYFILWCNNTIICTYHQSELTLVTVLYD
jgi:hypothetical protein